MEMKPMFSRVCLVILFAILAILSIHGNPTPYPAQPSPQGGFTLQQATGSPVIRDISFPETSVGAYEKFEASFQVDGQYDNPYDPDEIDVVAHFTYPDGQKATVPAFFDIPYASVNGSTLLNYSPKLYRSTGQPSWKVRFSGGVVGTYHFYITAKDSQGRQTSSKPAAFTVKPSASQGYIRIATDNPTMFEHSADGSLFYGSGSNIAWVRSNDTKDPSKLSYDYFMKQAEGNTSLTRVWLCHWAWLEWTRDPGKPDTAGYGGKLQYNQYIASAMDQVFQLAEQANLKFILALDDNNELMDATTYDSWAFHPYNAKNGGPAVSVEDYWKNSEVRTLYKKRLRYIIARWGYSTSLMTLNAWNDMTRPNADQVDYLQDLRDYVHELADDYRPVIYGSNFRFQANEVLDYVYSGKEKDQTKPNVQNETYYTRDADWFKTVLQGQVWDGLVTGDAARMVWPHNLVDQTGSWSVFRNLLAFVRDVPLNKQRWSPMAVQVVGAQAAGGTGSPGVGDPGASGASAESAGVGIGGEPGKSDIRVIQLEAYGDVPNFGVKAPDNVFAIDEGENNQWLEGFGVTLYGSNRKEWRNPPTLVFTPPADTTAKLLVEVNEVGGGTNTLQVDVNGKTLKSVSWSGGRQVLKGEERFVEAPLAAGENRIKLDNTGGDWLRIQKIYVLLDSADPAFLLTVRGLGSGDAAILYINNQTYGELYRKVLSGQPVPMRDVSLSIGGLADGPYEVVLYDPTSGSELGKQSATSKNGVLPVHIERMQMDMALKIRR
jgi:hypothetical protein